MTSPYLKDGFGGAGGKCQYKVFSFVKFQKMNPNNTNNNISTTTAPPTTTFDLETYASRYHGRTKIQRLLFIASLYPSMKSDALRLAITEAKNGFDTTLYRHILDQVQTPLGEGYETDEEWIKEKEEWANKEKENLDTDSSAHHQPANRELTRSTHNDLGEFNHKIGKLEEARRQYTKTRDYCMSCEHNLQMCVKVVTVNIQANDFSSIESYYKQAESMPDIDNRTIDMSKLIAYSGLSHLVRGNYQLAAARFIACNPYTNEEKIATLPAEYKEILSLEDIAIYGALCALATMDRASLTTKVMKKPQFHCLLELVPSIREIVHDFYATRYTRLFQTMESIRQDLLFDMYLARDNHLDRLYQLIRRKAMVQYIYPFISVDLTRMKTIFNTSSSELENELLYLIELGDVHARIDRQNNALMRKRVDFRRNAFIASLSRGQEAFDDAETMLLRMTLVANDMTICSPTAGRGMVTMGPRNTSLSSVADNVFDPSFQM